MRPDYTHTFQWLRTGDEAFSAMLAALDQARETVRLEAYIFAACALGERFRQGLVAACRRAVRVRVLVDAFGSMELADDYWAPVRAAGGDCRWFNPLSLRRFGFRDHRKLLVCDERVAFVGGFNIAPEYEGDGVTRGWCDHGLQVRDTLAAELAAAFDTLFALADFPHRPFTRWRKSRARKRLIHSVGELLLSGPGRGFNPLKRSLCDDLRQAHQVQVMSAYFLPPWQIRRGLMRVARRGGRVQLILAGKSDVPLAQAAAQSLYGRLMRAGVELYEYQPQVLHAKLIITDHAVYAGSANLDTRSLHINYELMVRLTHRPTLSEARAIFAQDLKQSLRVDPLTWRQSRSFWDKLAERWAYFLLARVDPYIARRLLRTMG